MNQQRRVKCWWVWCWILLSHIVLVLFLSEGLLRKCWHLQTCKSAKPSFLYKPSYTDRLTFCTEKVEKKYCFALKVKKMLSSYLGHWINWGHCLFPPLHTFCSTECLCTRLLRWELRGIYSWWDIHIQGCSMHTLHRKGAALMSWAGCSELSTGLTFALFPASCSDPALKTISFISIWGFQWAHNSLTAETFTVTFLHSITPKWWGLAVSLQTGSCCVPGRLRPNTTTLNRILNSPNQIFGIVFCVPSTSPTDFKMQLWKFSTPTSPAPRIKLM